MKKLLAALVFVCFASTHAYADEPLPSSHVRLQSGPGQLIAPDGKTYFLPMGTHILDGTTFEQLDEEVRRLQEAETRLTAEKASLSSGTGWPTIVLVALGSIALGVTVGYFAL